MGVKLEKDLQKSIQQRLEIYQLTGEVVWWGRLNSLKVKTLMGSWIQGCPKGTPDIIALIRNKQQGLTALFLELKSESGQMTTEQREFWSKYNRKSDVVVLEIREPKQLDDWINDHSIDFTEDLPKEL